ncbi:MAG: substrate-binding domain-containing protein [Anaerolineae bacterium]|nr:substrate-binding domain-containing protein [Anaerolineae bacterium]MBN8618026.1 substrate-binding domain-containing protein [Anaerolineae bacterium]
MAKSKPTMRDVAQAADVSATTVWMVVHNKPGIPLDTVEKVRTAIQKLSYTVKLENNNSRGESVGLLIEQSSIPAISDVFYGDIIRGFQAEAKRLGYYVLLSTFDRNTQDLDLLKMGFSENLSGFVVANDGDILPETVIQLKTPNIPVVLIESYIEGQTFPSVLGDNFMAGYKIARYMLDQGHRKIAILKGPTKYSSLVDRLRGCLAAMAEANLLPPAAWMPEPVSGHPLKGYVQMKEILAQPDHPTAVIAISDKTAFGAMEAIREAGLNIPGDIAIGSIDNTMESGYTRPPLTTVHIPKYEIGVLALRKLHRLIEGSETLPFKSIVYSELIVRESC